MTTQPTLIAAARKVRPVDLRVAAEFLIQHADAPRPASLLTELDADGRVHITLLAARSVDVETWAEAMNVDTDRDRNGDGTWTDEARGFLPVIDRRDAQGRPLHEEIVSVHVYWPGVDHTFRRTYGGITTEIDPDTFADRTPCTCVGGCRECAEVNDQ